MQLKKVNSKEERLNRLRYHWALYVARGGFNEPKMQVGSLEEGGLFHWTLFLQIGRNYLLDFPKEKYILASFIPEKMLKLLTGE